MPNGLEATGAAIAGLIFGSFLNVCITRLPRGESVQHPRSHCRNCRRMIPWHENIPLLGFAMLRGKCRGCGAAIPWRYPIVEAGLAVLWTACFLRFGANPMGARAAVFCFLLLGLMFTDMETLLLPDALTLSGIVIGLAFSVMPNSGSPVRLEQAVMGAAIGAGILLIISGTYYLVRRHAGMGMGDVKLLAMIGAFLGPGQVLLVFFLGTMATAAGAVAWLLARALAKESSSGDLRSWARLPLPYGTFLAASGLVCLFYGRQIINWYLKVSGLS